MVVLSDLLLRKPDYIIDQKYTDNDHSNLKPDYSDGHSEPIGSIHTVKREQKDIVIKGKLSRETEKRVLVGTFKLRFQWKSEKIFTG